MSIKIQSIINSIENLTLSEILQLIENLEQKFSIITNNLVKIENTALLSNEDIKTSNVIEYTLILDSIISDKKISVLKLVRNLTGLGLKESKEIVDNLPHILKEKVLKEEAEKIQKEFKEIGGNIILK